MADININDIKDLRPAGSDFFTKDEGYLSELSEDELSVWGGGGNDGITLSLDSKASVKSNLSLSVATKG